MIEGYKIRHAYPIIFIIMSISSWFMYDDPRNIAFMAAGFAVVLSMINEVLDASVTIEVTHTHKTDEP